MIGPSPLGVCIVGCHVHKNLWNSHSAKSLNYFCKTSELLYWIEQWKEQQWTCEVMVLYKLKFYTDFTSSGINQWVNH